MSKCNEKRVTGDKYSRPSSQYCAMPLLLQSWPHTNMWAQYKQDTRHNTTSNHKIQCWDGSFWNTNHLLDDNTCVKIWNLTGGGTICVQIMKYPQLIKLITQYWLVDWTLTSIPPVLLCCVKLIPKYLCIGFQSALLVRVQHSNLVIFFVLWLLNRKYNTIKY